MKIIYLDPYELCGSGSSQEHVYISTAPYEQFESIEQFYRCTCHDLAKDSLWQPNTLTDYAETTLENLSSVIQAKELISELCGIKIDENKVVLLHEVDWNYLDFIFTNSNIYYRFIWQTGA